MLHASKSSKIDFIHGAINSNFHALAGEVNELAAKNPAIKPHFRYSHPSDADIAESNHHSTGYIDQELLKQYITPETEVYFCGPKPMMIQVYKALKSLGHPAEKIHFEFFGPHDELEA
jgi:nitric oxide dioxygenase